MCEPKQISTTFFPNGPLTRSYPGTSLRRRIDHTLEQRVRSNESGHKKAMSPLLSSQARGTNDEQCHEQDTQIAINDRPDTTNLINDASESSSTARGSSTSSTSGQSSRGRSSSASNTQFVALAPEGQGSISEYQNPYEDEHQQDVHNAPPNEIEVDSVRVSDVFGSPLA